MQNSYLSLTCFLKYYKDITNLILVLLTGLVAHTISDRTTLYETLMFIHKQKINLIPQFFLKIQHFKNSAIWLVKDILVDNSRTRILPDIGSVVESQEVKELSLWTVLGKIKWQHFQKKKRNTLFLGPLCPMWAEINFPQKSGPVTF